MAISPQIVSAVGKFDVFEATFSHSGSVSNPYTSISAVANLTSPSSKSKQVDLFWDGGTTWKFRFACDEIGTWNYTTSSSNSGLNGKSGNFSCTSSSNKGGIVKHPSAPYHFAYQDGTPFYFFGDTEWSLFASDTDEKHTRSTVFSHIDERASQKINVIHGMLLHAKGWNNEGGAPFTSFSSDSLNPGYWQEVDARIQYLNSRGIVGGLLLSWAADNGYDWRDFTDDTDRKRYARYVGARYGAYNVYFITVGEYSEYGSGGTALVNTLGAEMASHNPHNRMIAVHGVNTTKSFNSQSWMSFGDYAQIYASLHNNAISSRGANKPVVNSEYAYYLRDQNNDGVVDKPNSANLSDIRNATWDIAMGGSYFITGFGSTYFGGHRHPDGFREPNHLISGYDEGPWESDMQHVHKFFTSFDWWTVDPHDSWVSGSGIKYALANPGQTYAVYVRGTSSNITLNLNTSTSKTYTVQRFNPQDGSWTNLSNYTGSGTLTLSPPNSSDHLFLIKASGGSSSTPTPTSTATPINTPTPTTVQATATPTPPVTIVPGDYVRVHVEAESATPVSPMQIGSENGVTYVSSNTSGTGEVTIPFSVNKNANYIVWARVYAPTVSNNSFYVDLDDGQTDSVDGIGEDSFDIDEAIVKPEWQWVRVNGRGGTTTQGAVNPRIWALSAGQHSITFRQRDSGTRLDRIMITDDSSPIFSESNPIPTGSLFCKEDINEDGIVDLTDYSILVADFFQAITSRSDINGDGIVDLTDYSMLVSSFFTPGSC